MCRLVEDEVDDDVVISTSVGRSQRHPLRRNVRRQQKQNSRRSSCCLYYGIVLLLLVLSGKEDFIMW
jgi:ferric iron reductase protein FhuF